MTKLTVDSFAAGWAKALSVDRKQFNLFFEKMLDAFAYHRIVVDKSGKPVDYVFLEVNDAFERLTGLRKEKILGKKVTQILKGIENDPANWIGIYGRVALTGEPAQFENYNESLGKWFNVSAYCPEKGYFVALFEEITERKKAEEALKASEENYKHLLDYAPTAIYEIDYKGPKFKSVNDAMCQMTGYSREELLKMNPVDFLDPESRERFQKRIRKGLIGDKVDSNVEYRAIVKDGRELWVILNVKPVYKEGKLDGALVVGHDITERKKAEEELRRAKEELEARVRERTKEVTTERQRLYSILETLPAYVVLLDKDYRMPFANKIFRERFGESLGRRCHEYLFKLDSPCENCETYKVMKNNKPHHWEWTGPDERDYDIYDFPFVEADGSTLILEMGIDITERNKAETLVKAERKRLFDVFETLPPMICLLTPDYHVAFANRSFRERFGESHGRHCYAYCFGKAEPCEFCETYNVLKTGQPHHWEVTGPDGSVIDAYDFPFTDVDGSPMILEMDIDITKQKRTEKQIRDVSAYSRSLIEASLDPLVTISVKGKITDVNVATELVTGCSREELIGSDFSDYFTEPEKAKIGYKHVFTEGFVRDYPLAIRHKSGKVTDVLYNAAIYTNEAGEMQGVFAAARDITELKNAEKMAQEVARKLQDAERLAAIGATAGMVGHDIRNPLQAMTSDVFLAKTDLASTPESEEKNNALESLEEIEKNIGYINKIVADLQDYARPLKPVAKETDLQKLIDELISKNGIPQNVKVQVNVQKDALIVMADSDILKRILSNLVTNAVQAMPEGGTLVIQTCKEGNDSIITVMDTGVGIPEEAKNKLFTPLFTTKSKGQGFGLAVVKRMTESLGGTVTFESERGKGTKFILRFPSNC